MAIPNEITFNTQEFLIVPKSATDRWRLVRDRRWREPDKSSPRNEMITYFIESKLLERISKRKNVDLQLIPENENLFAKQHNIGKIATYFDRKEKM